MPAPTDAESLRLLYFSVKFAGTLNTDMQKVADTMGLPSARAAGDRLRKLMTRMEASDPVDETPTKKRTKPVNQGSGGTKKRRKSAEEAAPEKPEKKQDKPEHEVEDEDGIEEGESSD